MIARVIRVSKKAVKVSVGFEGAPKYERLQRDSVVDVNFRTPLTLPASDLHVAGSLTEKRSFAVDKCTPVQRLNS